MKSFKRYFERRFKMASEAVHNASENAEEIVKKTAEIGKKVVSNGYDAARQYTDTGLEYVSDLTGQLSGFVKREPWMAVAGAFIIGYFAAHMLRRLE
jgi:ElaB/YqjD/DUF883 family membrane-anchored ribosome-binding protein